MAELWPPVEGRKELMKEKRSIGWTTELKWVRKRGSCDGLGVVDEGVVTCSGMRLESCGAGVEAS